MSYLLAGRRTYIDWFTAGLKNIGAISQHLPYFFQDLHAKVTRDFGGLRRLSVSGYRNSESLKVFNSQETLTLGLTWGNTAVSVHYRDQLSDKGIIDVNLGHSRFSSDLIGLGGGSTTYQMGEVVEYVPPTDTLLFGDGSMGETRADMRVTWHARRATVTAGTQATSFSGDHDHFLADDFEDDDGYFFSPLNLREVRLRLAAYSSVKFSLDRGFSLRSGLRVDRFQGLATTLAPFGELSYQASWWDVRVSAARSHQALASLRNEEALGASFLAYDLMVPVSEAPVPRNTEFSIGWGGSRWGVRVRVDAYARTLDHLRLPDLGVNPITDAALGDPSSWRVSSGSARGIEASWSWMWDRGLSVLGSYRWATVSRTVGARTYTPRFHRNHEFELNTSYSSSTSSWSMRVALRSGQPTTPVLAIIPAARHRRGSAGIVPIGGEYNAETLPGYARIDVGWRRESELSWFDGVSLVPYLSVANLFNLPNVVASFVDREVGGNIEKVHLPHCR